MRDATHEAATALAEEAAAARRALGALAGEPLVAAAARVAGELEQARADVAAMCRAAERLDDLMQRAATYPAPVEVMVATARGVARRQGR